MMNKLLLKSLFILLISPVVFTLLMIGVYSLPVEPMFTHAAASVDVYQENRIDYWTGLENSYFSNMEPYTDYLMINTATFPTTRETVVHDAVNNPQKFSEKLEWDEPFFLHLSGDDSKLEDTIYPRFWHGYMIWLKPMLLFFNISEIRIINLYLTIALCGLCLILLYKEFGWLMCIAFSAVLFIMNPLLSVLTLQGDALTIPLAAIIFMIWKKDWLKENRRYVYFFLTLGIITSFIMFLTYPLVTLALPLTVWILMNRDGSLKELLATGLACGLVWAVGFAFNWAAKWAVSYLLTGYNAIADAAERAARPYTEGGSFNTTFYWVFMNNLYVINVKPFKFVYRLTAVLLAAGTALTWHRKKEFSIRIPAAVCLLIIAVLPLAWYFVMRSHSAVHLWWSHKELAISFFALFCLPQAIVKEK